MLIPSIFSRSVVQIISFLLLYLVLTGLQNLSCPLSSWFSSCSLFFFANGVFAISFISIVFFLSICPTSQGLWVSLVCQRSNFVLPLPFSFLSGAIPRSRDEILL